MLHNVLAAGTTACTIQVTDSPFWMLTMMEHRFPSQHRTPPRTPQGEKTRTFHITVIIVTYKLSMILAG